MDYMGKDNIGQTDQDDGDDSFLRYVSGPHPKHKPGIDCATTSNEYGCNGKDSGGSVEPRTATVTSLMPQVETVADRIQQVHRRPTQDGKDRTKTFKTVQNVTSFSWLPMSSSLLLSL